MKKKIILVLAACAVLGVALYCYMYKNHRDITSENADYTLTVKELQRQFGENLMKSNQQYSDKTIAVTGKVTAIDLPSHTVTVDDKVSATFKDSLLNGIVMEKPVKIKGRFVGYDDLLEEFKMDEVSLME